MKEKPSFNQLVFGSFFYAAFMIGMFLQMLFFCKGASLLTTIKEDFFFILAIILFFIYDKSKKIRIFILPFQIVGAIAMCIEEKEFVIYLAALLSFAFAYVIIKKDILKK